MLTSMATDDLQANGNGFRRQVTFRVGPEDAPLLEVAAVPTEAFQGGIVAAPRAYAAERLTASRPRKTTRATLALTTTSRSNPAKTIVRGQKFGKVGPVR
jgi:hypothetical protein